MRSGSSGRDDFALEERRGAHTQLFAAPDAPLPPETPVEEHSTRPQIVCLTAGGKRFVSSVPARRIDWTLVREGTVLGDIS